MRRNRMSMTRLSVAVIAAASPAVAPAHADAVDDSFLAALNSAGVDVGDQADVVALGHSVCPQLSQPAGTAASTASSLTGHGGLSPAMAGIFTSIAVSVYCPQLVSQLSSGQLPELIPGVPGASLLPGLVGVRTPA